MRPRTALILVGGFMLVGCTAEQPTDEGGEWQGTIESEGNVTTVVNESGSVWGGTAKLVEEASIGVDQGADEYMFGNVVGITASDREIYVLDPQIPAVRVYDYEGNHLRDIGQGGQGPGEFENPRAVEVAPDGRLFVKQQARITVFSDDGGLLETWPVEAELSSGRPMVLTAEGTLFFDDLMERSRDISDWKHGMRAVGPEGARELTIPVPELDFEPYLIVHRVGGGGIALNVPFGPQVVWTLAPSGSMIAGFPEDYRFEIHRPGGGTTVVEKTWTPVPISNDEAEWNRVRLTSRNQQTNPDWQWNGPPIPDNKPAYSQIVAGRGGRIWIFRIVGTEDVVDCDPDPRDSAGRRARSCWRQIYGLDVFDEETGRYLGDVEVPPEAPLSTLPISRAFIKGNVFITRVEDDKGTIMVKRYRLVLPGEE